MLGNFLLTSPQSDRDPERTGTVVRLNDFRNREVIRFCELLLQKAIAGEVTGMIYTLRLNDEDQPVGAVGVYAKDPSIGLPVMASMADVLSAHVKSSI